MEWTWLKTKPTNRTDLHLQWLGKRIFPVTTIWEVTVTPFRLVYGMGFTSVFQTAFP